MFRFWKVFDGQNFRAAAHALPVGKCESFSEHACVSFYFIGMMIRFDVYRRKRGKKTPVHYIKSIFVQKVDFARKTQIIEMDQEIDILVLFLRKYTKLKFLVSDFLRLEM